MEHGVVVEHLGVEVEVALASGRRRVRVPRKSGIVVGDDVTIDPSDGDRIEALARRSELVRRSFGGGVHVVAANVDIVLVVAALDPPARAGLIDRASVAARAASIEPVVVVNKVDLADATGVLAELRARLAGELVMHEVSARNALGMDALARSLVGKRAVLVGPSGVGKSSLKNALVPGLALETRALSDTRGAGMHTTTSSTLHALPGGGEIVDTPGVREYGLVDVMPRDLALYFPGFAVVSEACRFRDCLHEEEPGCAIKAAVADGRVREGRYVAYRNLLAETKSVG